MLFIVASGVNIHIFFLGKHSLQTKNIDALAMLHGANPFSRLFLLSECRTPRVNTTLKETNISQCNSSYSETEARHSQFTPEPGGTGPTHQLKTRTQIAHEATNHMASSIKTSTVEGEGKTPKFGTSSDEGHTWASLEGARGSHCPLESVSLIAAIEN